MAYPKVRLKNKMRLTFFYGCCSHGQQMKRGADEVGVACLTCPLIRLYFQFPLGSVLLEIQTRPYVNRELLMTFSWTHRLRTNYLKAPDITTRVPKPSINSQQIIYQCEVLLQNWRAETGGDKVNRLHINEVNHEIGRAHV